MSRSGYSDDGDCDSNWPFICWRGAVASAMRGKRGQQTLQEIAEALDAMPVKELAKDSLRNAAGEFCTLGALGHARGMDMSRISDDDRTSVAKAFNISEAMAAEIMDANDEHTEDYEWKEVEICGPMRFPRDRHIREVRVPVADANARRWSYMRNWIQERISKVTA